MWQYSGTDVPVFDPSLTNVLGLGNWTFGLTTPIYGTPINTIGTLPFGTSHLGFTPFVHPLNWVKTDVTPFVGWNTTPMFWNTPFGIDRFSTWKVDTLGMSPWFVGSPFGFKLADELWHRTVPFTWPIYSQTFPFMGTLGHFGTPYGVTGYTPFGFTGLEEKFKFGTPFTTGLFGFRTTPFQTPIDWKVKSFGTPVGMTTNAWTKTVSLPWTTGRIPGPVAVL